jgi:hypothetical protein
MNINRYISKSCTSKQVHFHSNEDARVLSQCHSSRHPATTNNPIRCYHLQLCNNQQASIQNLKTYPKLTYDGSPSQQTLDTKQSIH